MSTTIDDTVLTEVRELLTDLRDASADGRMLADRLADLVRSAVEGYCGELDRRAETILKKLDQAA